MSDPRDPQNAPTIFSDWLRDMSTRMSRLETAIGDVERHMLDRQSGLEHALSKVEFEMAGMKQQLIIANGRTTKIENRLATVAIDEIPYLRNAFTTRMEEMEGNVEMMQQQQREDMARLEGRREQRAEDRAKLGFIWEFVGKELWKYVLVALASAAGMGVAGVMGWLD